MLFGWPSQRGFRNFVERSWFLFAVWLWKEMPRQNLPLIFSPWEKTLRYFLVRCRQAHGELVPAIRQHSGYDLPAQSEYLSEYTRICSVSEYAEALLTSLRTPKVGNEGCIGWPMDQSVPTCCRTCLDRRRLCLRPPLGMPRLDSLEWQRCTYWRWWATWIRWMKWSRISRNKDCHSCRSAGRRVSRRNREARSWEPLRRRSSRRTWTDEKEAKSSFQTSRSSPCRWAHPIVWRKRTKTCRWWRRWRARGKEVRRYWRGLVTK